MINLSKFYHCFYLGKERVGRILMDVFFQDLSIKIYSLAIICLNLLTWLAVILLVRRAGDDLLVLHYSVDFGVDLVGDPSRLYMIPVLGMVVFLSNVSLLFILYRYDNFKFFSHLLLAVATLVNLFLLISLGPIYLFNFS